MNSKSKHKRHSRLEVSKFIAKKNIHRAIELYAEAEKRKKESQTYLAAFVLLCTEKSLNDLIESTCEIQNAKNTLGRDKTSRMQLLEIVRLSSCVDGWAKELCICSRDILQKNRVNPYAYAETIRDLLMHERAKFINVMITFPSNCGKNLMLKPLEIICNAFINPANDKHAWVGADNEEMIILEGFRWSSELICWKDVLSSGR